MVDTPHKVSVSDASEISRLCLACGMCCDGSLFTIVEVTAEEKKRLTPLGFSIYLSEENETVFAQPCPRLKNKGCSIYDDRPTPCRSYECYLVQALRDGETPIQEAVDLVTSLHRQQEALRLSVPISLFLMQPVRSDIPMPDALVGQDDLIPRRDHSFRDFLYDMKEVFKGTLAIRRLDDSEKAWLQSATIYLTQVSDSLHKKKILKHYQRLMKAAG